MRVNVKSTLSTQVFIIIVAYFVYRRAHIDRQKEERINATREKNKCKELDEQSGQPLQFFLKLDGMTAQTCKTPKVGVGRKSQSDDNAVLFENRIIGVEVPLFTAMLLMGINFNIEHFRWHVDLLRPCFFIMQTVWFGGVPTLCLSASVRRWRIWLVC